VKGLGILSAVFFSLIVISVIHASDDSSTCAKREAMIRAVPSDLDETSRHVGRDRLSPHVLEAMRRVPRHEFVPEDLKPHAYENRPLPIGYGQTISQPYIVALMTELLDLKPDDTVLEIGTGSGYQAAVLAECAREVYSIEIIPELAETAQSRLLRLGYRNVTVKTGDGYFGWEERAPFDAIIVTAAATHIPPPLVHQLKPGGTMVIPVGPPFMVQHLTLVKKTEDGKVSTRQLLPVAFVPLIGGKRTP